jgi:hypothetical protein
MTAKSDGEERLAPHELRGRPLRKQWRVDLEVPPDHNVEHSQNCPSALLLDDQSGGGTGSTPVVHASAMMASHAHAIASRSVAIVLPPKAGTPRGRSAHRFSPKRTTSISFATLSVMRCAATLRMPIGRKRSGSIWSATKSSRRKWLTTQQNGEHHVTIPDHANLRIGTLAGILADVADHFKIERGALAADLFER